ncbi:MAG: hypothetical protein ABSD03_15815 [Vulcanimicrobiaceae bacterium]
MRVAESASIDPTPDCEHPGFDVMGCCVSCARDYSAQRDDGATSRACSEREARERREHWERALAEERDEHLALTWGAP